MTSIFKWLKGQLAPSWSDCVLFEIDSLPYLELKGIIIEEVGPGDTPAKDQMEFLSRDISSLRLWRLMRFQKRGKGVIFFARVENELCHYTFSNPGTAYKRMFPIIGSNCMMIGPCMTDERFRGQRIYPKVLAHVVNSMQSAGKDKCYIYTHPSNIPSIRGIESVGFKLCGCCKTKRYLLGLYIITQQTDCK